MINSPSRFSRIAAIVAACFLCALWLLPCASAQAQPAPYILDQDFSGPGGSDLQAVLFLLNDPKVELLGLTGVTGDDWVERGAARALGFLELAGHPEIPVYKGARVPLVNTPQRLARWESQYGKLGWKGAWNDLAAGAPKQEFDPANFGPLEEGNPRIKTQPQPAAEFLIEQVNRRPGEITIIAEGPLTNLALAIRLDPDFPKKVKSLVVSESPEVNMSPIDGKAAQVAAFNGYFDPEAAQIVLSAPFPSIISAGFINRNIMMDDALAAEIAKRPSPLAQYLAKYAWKGLPMWDEIVTAIAVDPSLVTKSAEAMAGVDLNPGRSMGSLIAYAPNAAPGDGARMIRFALAFDEARFRRMFFEALDRTAGR